ncbi:hypothetical protein PF007_g27140 [Phytophthora fragariae]|uniref:Uncharacterized protein n=1 Tax=Phytophthora fragariae TaxID=53985 RepID=A0A6A3Q6Y2_9STRA|nr:hypothetical protein PF007_g27140 [Phytophthora fragariae]
MKASPTASPREEWLTTIAALYAISHRLVSIDKELVPTGKQRYPKLKGDEKALLYTLFRERCVLSEENATSISFFRSSDGAEVPEHASLVHGGCLPTLQCASPGYWVSLEQTVGQRWDIGRLMAYLQRHLVVDFELEDLDECTPDSRTSTVWKLTMKSAECPEYLRALAMSSVW